MSSPDDKAIEKKIDVILAAVQSFGLNFIQKIGELKHEVGVLTDQVEKMNKALITVKGLEPKIDEMTKIKQELTAEMHLMQSMIKASTLKNPDIIKMKSDDEVSDHLVMLENFKTNIRTYNETSTLARDLEEAKKKIYEITGGHRILFEMGEIINQYRQKESLSEPDIRVLEEKVTFWLNKLKS